jgi:hypothetical protein
MPSAVAEAGFTPDIDAGEESSTATEFSLEKALTLSAGAVAGRVALQNYPSIEPILAFATVSGFYLGSREGFLTGSTAYVASNFLVWGAQGPWTVFQALGAGAAGFLGGKFSGIGSGRFSLIASLVAGTIVFELAVNAGSLLYMPWTLGSMVPYMLAAVPFGLVHMASTLGFGVMLDGFKEQIR